MPKPQKSKDSRTPPRRPTWNIWQGLFIIAFVTVLEFPLGWLSTPKDLLSLSGILKFLGVGLGDVFLYVVVIWIFMRLIRRPFSDLGFVRPHKRFLLLGFVVGCFLFVSIGLLGNELTKILGIPAPQSFALAVKGANYPWEFALLILLGGVIAPIKEEMLFRGLIYPPLREAHGRGKGILLTGIFFALLHFDLIRLLPLFLGGIVLTWLYERSSSIWPSVVAHGTWNILMALALWIQRY
ncbi:type II CAAX endopeptidase family protein [Desulfosporosinus sp. PR]|uniref:CPBP family intramembrane glutamic endopeptidase n=1 Tax=Candidatus Desulfosporosinus nitrosoreducens TaxID=3401928 RepID=UPI0027FD48CC|nr:type II CAAX endopeptidase family protein [Desulfosporosinus sp. PR]MDQ7094415.1 type II CAAX endopeptidase family protein [Desulfosporosinus sp. PR]